MLQAFDWRLAAKTQRPLTQLPAVHVAIPTGKAAAGHEEGVRKMAENSCHAEEGSQV